MKRSDSGSGIKRSYSDSMSSEVNEDESKSMPMFLVSQNKALAREMFSYKRQLAEARRELEMMRLKSREMEGLVSVIQRAWSQLDIDASMLLDVLGDADCLTPTDASSDLLFQLLQAGAEYQKRDPTDLSAFPKFNIDEWSTVEEVEREKLLVQADVETALAEVPPDDRAANSLALRFGGMLEDNIAQHSTFTLSLLERVCVGISESGVFERTPEVLQALIEAKAVQAERLLLLDRIAKLSTELVEHKARIHLSETRRVRCEKAIEKKVLEIEVLSQKLKSAPPSSSSTGSSSTANSTAGGSASASIVGQSSSSGEEGSSSSGSSSSSSSIGGEGGGGKTGSSASLDSEAETVFKKKIQLLERQLTESETAKAKVEIALTERLARPLAQTDAQVTDMRKAMEDLRAQCKQRVAMLFSECTALQDKVTNLEAALEQVEAVSAARCEDAVAQTEAYMRDRNAEMETLRNELVTAKAELALSTQLKKQLVDCEALEQAARLDATKLRERVRVLMASQEQLEGLLTSSRQRELALENKLQEMLAGATGSDSEAAYKLLAEQSQTRALELEAEIKSSKASVNDLFVEIEAVAAEEAKSRELCVRLQSQVSEGRSMQEGVLEENLKLQSSCNESEAECRVLRDRMEAIDGVMRQQDSVLAQLRKSEKIARVELASVRRAFAADIQQYHVDGQAVVEAQQNLSLVEKTLAAEKKRTADLQRRCDDLSHQIEKERTARMTAQREARNRGRASGALGGQPSGDSSGSGSGSGSSSSLTGDDAAMLDMTLNMLRCSVCRDRFKDVAITRCFHLFCRECIDENLRNRHRKCPACGEKFGQDDVKSVYFTH